MPTNRAMPANRASPILNIPGATLRDDFDFDIGLWAPAGAGSEA
jgi:hypothetical protein